MISHFSDIIDIIDGRRKYTLLDCLTSIYTGCSQITLGVVGSIVLPLWTVYNFLENLFYKLLIRNQKPKLPRTTLEADLMDSFSRRGIVADIYVYDNANSYLIKRRK